MCSGVSSCQRSIPILGQRASSLCSPPRPPVLVISEGLGHERRAFLELALVAGAQGRAGSPLQQRARLQGSRKSVLFGGGFPSAASRGSPLPLACDLGRDGSDQLGLASLGLLGLDPLDALSQALQQPELAGLLQLEVCLALSACGSWLASAALGPALLLSRRSAAAAAAAGAVGLSKAPSVQFGQDTTARCGTRIDWGFQVHPAGPRGGFSLAVQGRRVLAIWGQAALTTGAQLWKATARQEIQLLAVWRLAPAPAPAPRNLGSWTLGLSLRGAFPLLPLAHRAVIVEASLERTGRVQVRVPLWAPTAAPYDLSGIFCRCTRSSRLMRQVLCGLSGCLLFCCQSHGQGKDLWLRLGLVLPRRPL